MHKIIFTIIILLCTYFTRFIFISHWSQAELLVGSFPHQFLLRHLPIFLFLLLSVYQEITDLKIRGQATASIVNGADGIPNTPLTSSSLPLI